MRIRDHRDAAAVATVTAGWTAMRHAIFATKRRRAIATVAGSDLDYRFVDELQHADF
jgi:hypothetical protein